MIYLDDHILDFDLQQALNEVSPQRRQYALRYRNERDQRLCIAAYRLLHRALLHEYGIKDFLQFTFKANGKPLLKGYPDIHFSMSHCHEAVAVAVSGHPIGIDIETTAHYSTEVARRVMSDNEMQQIEASTHPEVAFTRLWTMKESLYKLTGDDNGGDIRNMLDNAPPVTFDTTVYPRYICTRCQFLEE